MREPGVQLIAMPWQVLELPSIQLGILGAILQGVGIRTTIRSLYLTFMEHCLQATGDMPEDERIGFTDYEAVARDHCRVGLGSWVFAVPPFRDAPHLDTQYLAYLRTEGLAEADIATAIAMRALVPVFLERCANEMLTDRPRVVGFTSTFDQNVPSLALARILKLHDPSIAIVFGGANCDGPMGAALHRAFPWVDVVVRGEGERVLPGLVKDLLAGGPVRPQPGLCYRDGGQPVAIPQDGATTVPLDEIPTPVYDEYFERLARSSLRDGLAGEAKLVYEASRGCWWGAKSHCTFCGLNGTTMAFRSKSPERVVGEITTLAARYQRLDFQVVDNILDPGYLRDVLPRLRDAGHDLRLFYEVKANLKREQVRLLRAAGVSSIQPGIESLSTPILRLMRKGVTAFQNIRLLKWCAEDGIQVAWNLLYGFPGEPPEEYERMAALVPSLTHLASPSMHPLVLERFSPYHERPEAWGLTVLGPLPFYRFLYPVDDATLAELAYAFQYRYPDGRDPETYVAPLRRAVEAWRAGTATGYRALRYRRGPDFLVVRDRRPGLEPADYTLEDWKAQLYLACENGATPREALAALDSAAEVNIEEVREFFEELVDLRLAFHEDGRYLALALPANMPEEA